MPPWFDHEQFFSLCLGLSKASFRPRRRSADDSGLVNSSGSGRCNDDLADLHDLDELKQIVRNQRKFIQQLQMRLRLNTPDIIQSPTIDKLNEQNRVKTSSFEELSSDVVSPN